MAGPRAVFSRLYAQLKYNSKLVDNYVMQSPLRPTILSSAQFPTTFSNTSFPSEVLERIKGGRRYTLLYNISMFKYPVALYFIVESSPTEAMRDIYGRYVHRIMTWLGVVNEYTNSTVCVKTLSVYIYHTPLKKTIGRTTDVLGENEVNTAFTRSCPKTAEIVIFRLEEWFKVFIHETFHTFGLDFSATDPHNCTIQMRKMFNVKSSVNLFEAYAECWARILYSVFGAFIDHPMSVSKFERAAINNIQSEQLYSIFQMVQVLKYIGTTYSDISSSARISQYQEHTNVLAYYVITAVLINYHSQFIMWCTTHNTTLLKFNNTVTNQNSLCAFIQSRYREKSFIEKTDRIKKYIDDASLHNPHNPLFNSLRMTANEYNI
jgi:hypothetical protein